MFTKDLSDHSIKTDRLLSRNVGKTFEAVLSNTESPSPDSITLVSQNAHIRVF
jgi:hypothetical protein